VDVTLPNSPPEGRRRSVEFCAALDSWSYRLASQVMQDSARTERRVGSSSTVLARLADAIEVAAVRWCPARVYRDGGNFGGQARQVSRCSLWCASQRVAAVPVAALAQFQLEQPPDLRRPGTRNVATVSGFFTVSACRGGFLGRDANCFLRSSCLSGGFSCRLLLPGVRPRFAAKLLPCGAFLSAFLCDRTASPRPTTRLTLPLQPRNAVDPLSAAANC
jgi:hypothetical protein